MPCQFFPADFLFLAKNNTALDIPFLWLYNLHNLLPPNEPDCSSKETAARNAALLHVSVFNGFDDDWKLIIIIKKIFRKSRNLEFLCFFANFRKS